LSIRLYDTKAREKREFVPADPRRLTMYVCGPTVYARAHIGNFRPEIVFDVLARLLRHAYPDAELLHARNFTDIDDKIMARAEASGKGIETITKEAEGWYKQDARALGVETLPISPRATEHLDTMIALMEELIERGHAYAADGHVLFDVESDP
jgi:cysteinyl-tRNA synthetase